VTGGFLIRLVAAAAVLATPAPAFASDAAAAPFSAPRDPQSYARALQCLTETIYYEARGESEDGQRAVAQVVLNRVRHPAYPNSICGVVYQGSERRTGCQFSFTCIAGVMGPITDATSWERARRLASAALHGYVFRPVGLALNYHTTAIHPRWGDSLVRQTVIGAHIFYRRPDSGSVEAFSQMASIREPSGGRPGAVNAIASASAPRQRLTLSPQVYRAARLEMTVVERPQVERPMFQRVVYERPPGFGSPSRNARRNSRAMSQATRAAAQAPAAPVRRGPRTTVENGVHVSRGS
jgi:Cell Wall Hydrolase